MTAAQLKASILQLAIQGKLVPQDPNDEPAEALLERIRDGLPAALTQRTQRAQRGAKSSDTLRSSANFAFSASAPAGKNPVNPVNPVKKYPPVTDDEKPFNLPATWIWCRLGEIAYKFTDGTHRTPKYSDHGIPFISVKNMSGGKLDFSVTKFITKEEHEEIYPRCNPEKGDLLISKVGTTGVPAIVDVDFEFSLFVSVALMKFDQQQLCGKYLYYMVYSPFVQEQVKEHTRGVGNKNWVIDDARATIVPLPPLAEQKRIVAKIEELMPLVERYAAAKAESDELEANLPDAFRKSVLQQAVEGKLVPQDPNDEPAEALLARIECLRQLPQRTQRAQRGAKSSDSLRSSANFAFSASAPAGKNPVNPVKKYPPVTDDEKPFDLPANWTWCRFGELFHHTNGKQLNSSDKSGKLHKYITTSNLYWGRFELNGLKEMPFKDEELERCTARKGDLLICEGGDVGRAAIWQEDYAICLQNHVHKARPYVELCVPYFYYLLRLYKDTGMIAGKGVGIKGLSSLALGNLIIPLPPLAEQKRIVAEVERLLALGEKLKT